MKNIKKRILPKYFNDVFSGKKTFELRKDEDNVQPGDILDLLEWDGTGYTGKNIRCEVTYVLRNCPEYGLMDGYCIIGIEAVGEVVTTEIGAEYGKVFAKTRQELKNIILKKCDEREKSGYDYLTDSDITSILEECERKKIPVTRRELEQLRL